MWEIAYSLIFRIYSRDYGHECKVDLILTVGPLRELLTQIQGPSERNVLDQIPN